MYVDYSKAFDTLDHPTTLEKVDRLGIRGTPKELIKSYLENRKHYTYVNGECSDELTSNVGVLQGSCDAPLIYIIYGNDIYLILTDADIISFADDIAITVVGKCLTTLQLRLNNLLTIYFDYCNYNKLCINKNKTKFMVISPLHIPRNIEININNVPIEQVNEFRYLGIHFDSKLKFKTHVDKITNKLSQTAGIAYRLGPKFDLNTAKEFYYSFVFSTINYGITVYGGRLMVYNCTELHRVYKRIIKNLFKKHFPNLNYSNILKEMNFMYIQDIYKFYILELYYRIKNLHYFENMAQVFNLSVETGHDLRRVNELSGPFPRVDTIKTNFIYQISHLWNALPNEIKDSDGLGTFKNQLKEYFMLNY